jgi:hypothetical protein
VDKLFKDYNIYVIILAKYVNRRRIMSEPVKFEKIYLGTPDGETEAQNEKFEELFCDVNNKYSEFINSHEKYMIIGSKGSGKTYLAHYICKKAGNNQKCKIIKSKDFLLDRLMNVNMDKDNDSAYVYALCKWFILDKLAKYILEIHPLKSKYLKFSSLYKLAKFIKLYENDNEYKDVKSTRTNSYEKEHASSIEGSKEMKKAASEVGYNTSRRKLRASSFTIEAERKKFYELLKPFEDKIIKALSKNDDIILLFDDLDELDKNIVEKPEDNDIIINLIKIAKDYNLRFKEHKKNIRLVLLLRTDILNKLQMYDTNLSKIKTSCGVELYWLTSDVNAPEQHPLMKMVLHKIKTCCNSLSKFNYKELYNMLFPEKIDGKQALDYLLDYSFGRPRDIVTYLNHVIIQYPQNTFFSAVSLKEARKLYSSDFYDELVNQAFFHNTPQYTQECINLVSGLKEISFLYDKIEDYYQRNKQAFPNIKNLNEALSFLYRIGVIGNVWKDERNKSYSSWSYRKDAMDDIDITKKFTVHYALRKKFSIQ